VADETEAAVEVVEAATVVVEAEEEVAVAIRRPNKTAPGSRHDLSTLFYLLLLIRPLPYHSLTHVLIASFYNDDES